MRGEAADSPAMSVGAKWMSQPVPPSPAVGRPRETGIETPERSQQTPPDC